MNLLNDIYYRPEYAQLYLTSDSSLFTFEYRDGDSVFVNVSIKRPISYIGSVACAEGFFDLETPYGYGGFFSSCNDPEFVGTAMQHYRERCLDEGVIAEFIRFHPFNTFPEAFPKVFDMLMDEREVVVVDVEQPAEDRWKQYSAKTRNILRKCAKTLTFGESEDLDTFEELYAQTMGKNNADAFYLFDRKYYRSLLDLEGVRLNHVSCGKDIIAMAFFMQDEELAHYHLSANDTHYLKLNGNYFMLDQAFNEARRLGIKNFMLGGGRTPDPADSLLRFKQKFSPSRQRFKIAGMVYNEAIYNEYVARWEELNPGNEVRYFLKYRLNSV